MAPKSFARAKTIACPAAARAIALVVAAGCCLAGQPASAQSGDFWSGQFVDQPQTQRQPRRERPERSERTSVMKPTAATAAAPGHDAASVAERTHQRKANAFVADFGTVAKMTRTEMMASGEPFHAGDIVAAHATFPIGSSVLIGDAATGRTLLVRIKDRPVNLKATIELSAAALSALGLKEKELDKARVRLVPVWVPTGEPLFWPRLSPKELASKDPAPKEAAALVPE